MISKVVFVFLYDPTPPVSLAAANALWMDESIISHIGCQQRQRAGLCSAMTLCKCLRKQKQRFVVIICYNLHATGRALFISICDILNNFHTPINMQPSHCSIKQNDTVWYILYVMSFVCHVIVTLRSIAR